MNQRYYEDIYIDNNNTRNRLLEKVQTLQTQPEQIKFIADYFTNKLPIEVICEIDDAKLNQYAPFIFDYSFLSDDNPLNFREKYFRRDLPHNNSGITLSAIDAIRLKNKEVIKDYPTLYSLKMGTCIMFAHEIKRLCEELNIHCEIEDKHNYNCYDYFQGFSTEHKKINKDLITKMHHYYNIIKINDTSYKLDIAGYLTAQDFNKNHNTNILNPEMFYFNRDIFSNPFDNENLQLA